MASRDAYLTWQRCEAFGQGKVAGFVRTRDAPVTFLPHPVSHETSYLIVYPLADRISLATARGIPHLDRFEQTGNLPFTVGKPVKLHTDFIQQR